MSVKDTNNSDNLLKQLKELFNKEITVGVHGDVGDDIFDRATWNEFGTHYKKAQIKEKLESRKGLLSELDMIPIKTK